MWRHAIVWNWSNNSMLSIFTCHLTRYTKILLNCSISTSSDKWNKICDIVTGRHDHDVTAWNEVIVQTIMLWHFTIEQSKQPYINRQWFICLAHLQANIDKVSFVTSYSHVNDVMASRYDIMAHSNINSMIFLNSATWKTIETKKESSF